MERLKEEGLELLPGVFKIVQQGRTDLIHACLSQVKPLSELIKAQFGDKGYQTIIKVITPFLTELVNHEELEIRDMARSKLGEIASLMTENDRSEHVLKVCLELVQEQQKDQNKISGLRLLGQLANLFHKEFVQGFVVTQLTALTHDPNDNVRTMTIEQIAKICPLLDDEVVLRKFSPEFRKLSQDTNWQVRLNFVEKCVQLAEHIPVEKRNAVFGDIFLNLLNDKTRWVKEAALQQLGHFLALQDNKHKSDKLFEAYLNIPKTIAKFNKEPQNKICFSVAETLPKIIAAQGESTWKPLSGLYKLLLKQDDEVKVILAKNVHLLSKSLTKIENKNELLSVIKVNFLSNNSPEKIRQEALKNLANFLEMLDPVKREELADIYSQLQQGNKKWRIRMIIANQIGILSRLFMEDSIVKIIIPISFQLCKDEVSMVRETACSQISILLKNNISRPLCELLIVENIKSFASYNRFTLRQAFALMCDGLLEDLPTFKKNFMTQFTTLAGDKVVNVKITLARVLLKHFDAKTDASRDPDIIQIYRTLAKEKSADIVKILKKEHTIIEEVISCSSSEHNVSNTQSETHSVDEKQDDDKEAQMEEAKPEENDDKPEEPIPEKTAEMIEKVEEAKHEVEDIQKKVEKDSRKKLTEAQEVVKEEILEKKLQEATDAVQVDEITPEVQEAIEEAEVVKHKIEETHSHKEDTRVEEEDKVVEKQPEDETEKEEQPLESKEEPVEAKEEPVETKEEPVETKKEVEEENTTKDDPTPEEIEKVEATESTTEAKEAEEQPKTAQEPTQEPENKPENPEEVAPQETTDTTETAQATETAPQETQDTSDVTPQETTEDTNEASTDAKPEDQEAN